MRLVSFNVSHTNALLIVLAACLVSMPIACTEDTGKPVDPLTFDDTYSGSVQKVFNASCVATDCHGTVNPGSGLVLTSWNTLVAGSDFGESIIPFRPEQSHMMDHITGRATPQMPLSRDPLPDDYISVIRQWIADGARNDAGEVPYEDSRKKIYVTNQASDQVSVIDADAMLVYRIVDVGELPQVESPHNVYVDRQNEFWYVTLINSSQLVQYSVETDTFVRKTSVGTSPANAVTSPDGTMIYVTDWSQGSPENPPSLRAYDTATLTEQFVVVFPSFIGELPHGLAINEAGTKLYTTHEGGNSVFEVELGDNPPSTVDLSHISLLGDGEDVTLQALQIVLDADERFGYVTCNGSGEIRIVDLETKSLAGVIDIGGRPWLAQLTPDGSSILVANWGSDGVDVIDTSSQTRTSGLDNTGFEDPVFARPHGVAITPDGAYAFISSENTNGVFPPHHPTEGGGDNGNVAVIELATNRVVKVIEVEVDPTGVAYANF